MPRNVLAGVMAHKNTICQIQKLMSLAEEFWSEVTDVMSH